LLHNAADMSTSIGSTIVEEGGWCRQVSDSNNSLETLKWIVLPDSFGDFVAGLRPVEDEEDVKQGTEFVNDHPVQDKADDEAKVDT